MDLQNTRVNDLVVSMVEQKVRAKTKKGEFEVLCKKGQVMGVESITHPGPASVTVSFCAEIQPGQFELVDATFEYPGEKIDWLRASAMTADMRKDGSFCTS